MLFFVVSVYNKVTILTDRKQVVRISIDKCSGWTLVLSHYINNSLVLPLCFTGFQRVLPLRQRSQYYPGVCIEIKHILFVCQACITSGLIGLSTELTGVGSVVFVSP